MPTRYLKPGVRDSEAINALSPLAETLFYRLLTTVDDYGRFDGRPAMVKAHCFPIKEMAVSKCAELLRELQENGLVALYEVDGKPYLQMQKWDNVPRAKESKFPPCADGCAQTYADACSPRTVLPVTVTVTETETETGNRKPIASRKRDTSSPVDCPSDVEPQTWGDWLALRKSKRAPVTPTVIEATRREAAKAGWSLDAALRECCARGWQGFKADWVAGRQDTGETPYQRAARQRMAEFAPGIAARAPNALQTVEFVIDAESTPRLEG